MGVLTASLRALNSVHTYCTGAAAGKADASEQRRFTPTTKDHEAPEECPVLKEGSVGPAEL